MECRRLIKFGRASYVISVPKQWVIANKLKKGDLIFLDDSSERLVVSPSATPNNAPKRLAIGTEKKPLNQIGSEIISAYLNNIDRIEIFGNDLKTHSAQIKALLADLPGLEIIEQSETSIVAHDFLDRSEVTLEPLFRRVDMLIRSMMQEVGDDNLPKRDREVNRLVFLIKRVLRSAIENPSIARSLSLNNFTLLKHWLMIHSLEAVGDEVKRVSRLLSSLPAKTQEKARGTHQELARAYTSVMKAFYTNTLQPARDFELSSKDLAQSCHALAEGAGNEPAQMVYHLKALNAQLKAMARTCIDFSEQKSTTAESRTMQALDPQTGFLMSH